MLLSSNHTCERVLFKQKLFLGIGFMAIFFANQGVGILATPYYQMTLGVDPVLLALAMKIPVFVASFLAPFIGQWSDRYQSSFGRRRPFLFVFPWFSCVIFGLIWMVPAEWDRDTQLTYFAIMVLIFYVFNTCWMVPMKCLAYEASEDHHERTRVMAFVTYFFKFGAIFYHWVFPIAQLSFFGGIIIGMKFVGWGVALIFLGLFGMLPGIFLKERRFKKTTVAPKISLLQGLSAIVKNRNMKILLAIIFTQLTLGSFAASMDYYVLVYYMNDGDIGAGATWKGVLSTSYAIAGMIAIAVLAKVSVKIGKINTMKWVYRLTIVGGLCKWFIYQPGANWWLVLDAIMCTAIWGSMAVIITSMIADQIDVDHCASNIRREGLFVSLQAWVVAAANVFSAVGAGFALNLIGFDALLGSIQTDFSITAMRVFLVAGTVVSALIGYWLIKQYDLDEQAFMEIISK